MEEQPDLFTRFFLVDRPEAGDPGHRSWLAIVSSIVTSHGGEIEVWSEHGRGTKVRVALPSVALHGVGV